MTILDNHQSFLFSTDLENDDLMSMFMFAQELTKHASQNPKEQFKLSFLVGEGDAGIKVATQNRVIELLQEQGLLNEKNITLDVIRGYADKTGSQAWHETDGEAFLSQAEIAAVKGKPGDGVLTNKHITTFLKDNPHTAVIGIKPHREFMDIAEKHASVFKGHTYYFTGSYNNRALWNPKCTKDSEATKQAMIDMLGAFDNAYMFESFSAHKANSTSSDNNADMFAHIKQAPEGSLLHRLATNIDSWNAYILDWDRTELPKVIDRVIGSSHLLSKDRDALIDMVSGKACELSKDDQAKISTIRDAIWNKSEALQKSIANLKAVPAKSTEIEPENVELLTEVASIALSNLQRLSRILGKWNAITGSELQFVNADCAFMATLLNDDVANLVSNEKCNLTFSGDFSTFEASLDSNIHICLPKGVTVDTYNAAREDNKSEVASEVDAAQEGLFKAVQANFLTSIESLAQSTPKAQADAGAGAGAGAVRPGPGPGAPILHAANTRCTTGTAASADAPSRKSLFHKP